MAKYTGTGKYGGYSLGQVYKVGDTEVYVYLPKNIGSNSVINGTIHFPGQGGYLQGCECGGISNYYGSTNDIPNAYIAVKKCSGISEARLNEVLECIKKQQGIEINVTDYSGFSAGGGFILDSFSQHLSKNPDAPQTGLTLYDPYHTFPRNWRQQGRYFTEDSSKSYKDYNPTLMKQMQENGSYVRVFAPNNHINDFAGTRFFNSAARNSIPTVIISSNAKHNQFLKTTTEDGWMSYFNGMISIDQVKNAHNYKITIPKVEGGTKVTWHTYKLADLQRASTNPNSCSQDLLDALNALEANRVNINFDYLSEIGDISKIATELSGVNLTNMSSYTSTSASLGQESAFLTKLKDITQQLGQTLTKEVNLIKSSEAQYLKMAAELKKDSESLNASLSGLSTELHLPLELAGILDTDKKKTEKAEPAAPTQTPYTGSPYGGSKAYRGGRTGTSPASSDTPPTNEAPSNEKQPEPSNTETPTQTGTPITNTNIVTEPKVEPIDEIEENESLIEDTDLDIEEKIESDTGYTSDKINDINQDIQAATEPIVTPDENTYTENTNTKGHSAAGTILTGVGIAAAGVGAAYAGKKYIDKKKENNEV